MYKISVIIPAYNAERTVEGAVCSVMKALSMVEAATQLIVIDDGSTDQTPVLLDRLAIVKNFSSVRLRVVHQQNTGCYQARLAGLKIADTEYFAFADADDAVDESIYIKMLAVAQKEQVDVVVCGCDKSFVIRTREEVLRLYVKPRLFGYGLACCMWDKLYRNQYTFNNWIEGDFKSMYEDVLHNLQLFRDVRSIAFITESLYKYSPNDDSVTRNFTIDDLAQFERVYAAKRELMGSYELPVDEELLSAWRGHELWGIFKKAIRCGNASWKKRKQNLRAIAMSVGFQYPIIRHSPLLLVVLSLKGAWLYRKVFNRLVRLCIR